MRFPELEKESLGMEREIPSVGHLYPPLSSSQPCAYDATG